MSAKEGAYCVLVTDIVSASTSHVSEEGGRGVMLCTGTDIISASTSHVSEGGLRGGGGGGGGSCCILGTDIISASTNHVGAEGVLLRTGTYIISANTSRRS